MTECAFKTSLSDILEVLWIFLLNKPKKERKKKSKKNKPKW